MFFYLSHYPKASYSDFEFRILDSEALIAPEPNVLYLHTGVQRIETFYTPAGKLILLGDPVFQHKESLGGLLCPESGNLSVPKLYEEVRGHYNWFLLHPGGVSCGSSFGALCPVYVYDADGQTALSSSSIYLAGMFEAASKNKRNLLERLLFNYPFFDSTWWDGIRLLDAHKAFSLGRGPATSTTPFDISKYFGETRQSSGKSLRHLAELFQEEAALFFPETPFGISFTGGFDGRTLVAAAKRAGKDFFTYSFGRPGDSDLQVPMEQAGALGIPYMPILLDEEYLQKDALESAISFMQLSEYNGNLGRPHYHFAARRLSEKTKFILTGNFGSELFRAMHEPGVMMTEHLINFFAEKDDSWKDGLAQTVDTLYPGWFGEELQSLVSDLEAYRSERKDWDPNHRFYHFVFHEIFRKYFGPELTMQRHYLNNRTPFLSLHFFRELNQTQWSGVHSRLFEKQKARRMKGQLFYSSFIREAGPELYRLNTNKGYSPADVLEPWRLPLLAAKVYLHKRLRRDEPDTNSVDAFFQMKKARIMEWIGASQNPLPAWKVQSGDLTEAIQWYSIAAGWERAASPLKKKINYENIL